MRARGASQAPNHSLQQTGSACLLFESCRFRAAPVAVRGRYGWQAFDSRTSLRRISSSQLRMPAIKSPIAVQSPRLFRKLKSRRWLRKRLATGFELSRGGPATGIEHSGPGASGTEQLDDLVMPALRSPCQRRCPRFGIRLHRHQRRVPGTVGQARCVPTGRPSRAASI